MKPLAEIRHILAEHHEQLQALHVANLWLFGSAARGEPNAKDLDFLVEYNEATSLVEFVELKFLLEKVFQMEIDLVSRGGCRERFLQVIQDDLQHVA